jgi:hypothetical protein
MGFESSYRFFEARVSRRAIQIIGMDKHVGVATLEYMHCLAPYYDFSFHEKALARPFYHLINLLRDTVTLVEGLALTLASLYFDRTKTLPLLGHSVLQLIVMLADCLLAIASALTFITRSIASLFKGYVTKDVPEQQYRYLYSGGEMPTHTEGRNAALWAIQPQLELEQELDNTTVNYESEPRQYNY